MNDLLNFQRSIAQELLEIQSDVPDPDKYDPDMYPYGKEPGANKLGMIQCPTCGKSATDMSKTEHANRFPNGVFLFKDELSASEYYISAMCQSCQDHVFQSHDEED